MSKLWKMVQATIGEEDGATMVEYAIMVVLIAAVSMLIITTIGTDLRDILTGNYPRFLIVRVRPGP